MKSVGSCTMPLVISRYQLSIARSVAEARSLLAARAFDAILTVDCLPDGTASDLIEHFRDQAVVFLARTSAEETAARALELGIENYLTKDSEDLCYLMLIPYQMEAARRQSRRATQLRESEARLRALNDTAGERDRFTTVAASVPGAIFSFRLRPDGTACFLYASPIIERFLRVAARDPRSGTVRRSARWYTPTISPLAAQHRRVWPGPCGPGLHSSGCPARERTDGSRVMRRHSAALTAKSRGTGSSPTSRFE